jgi:hypothetical protein
MPPKKGKQSKTAQPTVGALTKSVEKMGLSKSARKRQNRRARANGSTEMNYYSNLHPISLSSDTGLRRLRRTDRIGLTDDGVAFLKCAFAPPDFTATSVAGVPDDYQGPSLVRKHRLVSSNTLTSGQDVYLLLLPVPGIAVFSTQVTAGTSILANTIFTGTPYTDFSTMFGAASTNNADIVTKFRHISNHLEIIPTVNQMTWSGQIQVWNVSVSVQTKSGGVNSSDIWVLEGLQGCNSTLANQYSGPFISGVYTACYSANPTFEFQPMIESMPALPTAVGSADFGQISYTGGIPGFDNGFQSKLIKISGVSATESYILKTWACVEYQINPNSGLYEFQSLSPNDKMALDLYRKIINELPIGVPFDQNEGFWKRVLSTISMISGVTANIPGTFGAVSRGVNLISNAVLPFA